MVGPPIVQDEHGALWLLRHGAEPLPEAELQELVEAGEALRLTEPRPHVPETLVLAVGWGRDLLGWDLSDGLELLEERDGVRLCRVPGDSVEALQLDWARRGHAAARADWGLGCFLQALHLARWSIAVDSCLRPDHVGLVFVLHEELGLRREADLWRGLVVRSAGRPLQ
jgi:hypothetical protein